MSGAVFVTGATGLVGGAVVRALHAAGTPVVALVRRAGDAPTVAAMGAHVVLGDLTDDGRGWHRELAEATAVVHCGLPRLPQPTRGGRVRRAATQARAAAQALSQVADPSVPRVVASHRLAGHDPHPGGLGGLYAAAEQGLAGEHLRVVRCGWVYGPAGFAPGMVAAVAARRFRLVGPADNPFPLIGDHDAAAAVVGALHAPAGLYDAVEEAPTQRELIGHLCAGMGVRGPDSVPVRVASWSLGSAMAQALAAHTAPAGEDARSIGWTPQQRWREHLIPRATAGGTGTATTR